eukprot:Phypoly_transcript_24355.p1 GENE.Phypoly_transcript_24355~~Phypoly_transcript_24355.p1  ORF type:complete len:111 (+),score=34.41 Phypoly_transcript_24355:60-392(+)
MEVEAERARQELLAKKFPFVDNINVEQYKQVDEQSWHPVLVVTLKSEITQSQRDTLGNSLHGISIITETPEEVSEDSIPPEIKAQLLGEAEEDDGEEEEEEEGEEQIKQK